MVERSDVPAWSCTRGGLYVCRTKEASGSKQFDKPKMGCSGGQTSGHWVSDSLARQPVPCLGYAIVRCVIGIKSTSSPMFCMFGLYRYTCVCARVCECESVCVCVSVCVCMCCVLRKYPAQFGNKMAQLFHAARGELWQSAGLLFFRLPEHLF